MKENKYLKKENGSLLDENKLLKNEIEKLKKEGKDLKIRVDNLSCFKDGDINKLDEKMRIMDNLVSKMNSNFDRQKTSSNTLSCGEKLIAINFVSLDQCINHSIICKNNSNFQDIEKELYLKYPEHAKNYSYFMYNGLRINRFKTLEQNCIHGYSIILNKIDNNQV